jgi:GNAT superfamily N-acetyltransferase
VRGQNVFCPLFISPDNALGVFTSAAHATSSPGVIILMVEEEMTYREIRAGEEEKVCLLVMDCFSQFVAPGYSQEGIAEFSRYVTPQSVRRRLAKDHVIILALAKTEIIGALEVRNNNHISLFFVDKEYQNRGVGKKLHQLALEKCLASKPDLAEVEVNSSPYAAPIYEKLGFVRVNVEQVTNGIRYTPMILRVA